LEFFNNTHPYDPIIHLNNLLKSYYEQKNIYTLKQIYLISIDMGRLVLIIRDELEEKFREAVFKRYGMKKGNLTKAIEEALELWITSGNKNTTRETHMRQKIYEGKKHG
jgi:hypothetical protein